ncbi:MAG: helix-turn-helix domain-containing protein [Planctomycetota bacterium]|nr:helix-turn-helix domain-containing protein [Planctomycetota bacterium]
MATAAAARSALKQMPVLPRLRSAIRHAGDRQVAFHSHEVVEFVYVTEGRTWIDVAGLECAGEAGALYVLPGKVPHNQRSVGHWKTQCLLFDHDGGLLDESPRVLDLARDGLFARWMNDLCELSADHRDLKDPVADALLLALLTRLARIEDQRRMMQALHPSLALAIAYLQQHLKEDVVAEELAQATHTSYSHLSALFRERFACGPLKRHQLLRLEVARKMLLNPYLSVDEVAQEMGYEDTNYFVRVFRKTYGCPPGKWRKQHAFTP